MKVVILAGGLGTRISEESQFRPKPMIEIGGQPILWHIMKEYSYYGFHDFIVCAGYKQHIIKEWFYNYFLHNSDVTFDYTSGGNEMRIHKTSVESWKVTIADTGKNTMTGGRIKRIQPYIGRERFMMTYGDGVCDVTFKNCWSFMRRMGKRPRLPLSFWNSRKASWISAEIMPYGRSGRKIFPTELPSMPDTWYLSRRFSTI